jgi:hypothetical protein
MEELVAIVVLVATQNSGLSKIHSGGQYVLFRTLLLFDHVAK